jgi:hypothetical protein
LLCPAQASGNVTKTPKNKVARHRVELRTAWMPAKQKYTGYQLSYCRILLKEFLILLEPKIFVPDMTPEPKDSQGSDEKII